MEKVKEEKISIDIHILEIKVYSLWSRFLDLIKRNKVRKVAVKIKFESEDFKSAKSVSDIWAFPKSVITLEWPGKIID